MKARAAIFGRVLPAAARILCTMVRIEMHPHVKYGLSLEQLSKAVLGLLISR